MADEPQDNTPTGDEDFSDISLITNDLTATGEDTPESTTEEGKDDAVETQDTPSEDVKPETVEGEQPPEETPKVETDDKAEQKRQNDAMAQRRIQERQRTRQQVEQKIDETYGPKTQEQLEEEGLESNDARYEALRQEIAYDKQRASIAELNAGMMSEAVEVANDFSVFNEKSKDYDRDFTAMVEQQYKTAARLQFDEQGIITNAEVPLYDFYKKMNDIYSRGTSRGTEEGQAQALKMQSRTEDIGSSTSTSKGPETLEEMEARLGDVVIT